MTGNYGGEILRKVRAFKPGEIPRGLFSTDLLAHTKVAEQTYGGLANDHPVAFAAFKQGPWHHHSVLSLEQTQVTMRSPYLDNELIRTAFRAPNASLSSNDACLRLIGEGNRDLLKIATDRGLAGTGNRLAAAANRTFLEFLFKAEYAYDMGMPQWISRIDHTLLPLRLDRLFLGRHKIFHFRVWYRDILSGYLRDTLLNREALARPYIDRKGVSTTVQGHLEGGRNYTNELHRLLTLELIQRCFVDKQSLRSYSIQPLTDSLPTASVVSPN
jgi:asparagine synthase (glutamine-hydrolysing)